MLPGLRGDLVGKTLLENATHWLIFFCVGIVTARYLQWATSIGIWSNDEKARGAAIIAPSKISIRKLLLLMGLAAVFAVSCKSFVGPSPLAIFQASVFQIFPIHLKPFFSAVVGGLLVPLHWFAMVSILKLKSFRTAGLILWLPVAVLLRWFSNAIYWDTPIAFPGSDALDAGSVWNSDAPDFLSYPPYPASIRPIPNWSVYATEAIAQVAFSLLALLWFRRMGFCVDFWSRKKKG